MILVNRHEVCLYSAASLYPDIGMMVRKPPQLSAFVYPCGRLGVKSSSMGTVTSTPATSRTSLLTLLPLLWRCWRMSQNWTLSSCLLVEVPERRERVSLPTRSALLHASSGYNRSYHQLPMKAGSS